MNKLFAKIASITAGLALVAGAGVALASHADAKGVKAATSLVATFECGADGSASHNDGSPATSYEETDGDYTLSISSGVKFYTGARDAKGNGAFKLGTGSAAASFSLAVPSDVDLVKIYVAGYKKNSAKVSINSGSDVTVSSYSDNGEYTALDVTTTSNKTIAFATKSGGYRCLINTIEFYAEEGGSEKEDTSVSITTAKPLALDINDSPVQLAVSTEPSSISSSLTYTSNNPSVASVSASGLVTPVGTGSTNITVAYAGDDQYKSSSDTISVTVSEAEPAHITGKTISQIVSEITAAGNTDALAIYEVEGYVTAWKTGDDGTQYGNFYIADSEGDTTNHAYVYGANYGNAPTWNGSKYTFSNNKTFLTNEVTSQIVIGSKITANFMAFMYGSTFEFQGEIKTVVNTAKVLESITLSGTQQTSFEQNEAFSYEGLIVTANYDDESSKEVTPTSVSTPDMTTTGNKTVTVSYTEGGVTKEATYTIQVHEMDPRHEVSFLPGEGSGSMDSVQVKEGDNYELPTTCTFTAPEGKVFDHWELNGETITIIESIDESIEVTAIYVDAPSEVEATMAAGENGSSAKVLVNSVEKDAIKVGTSSKGGSMTITVGAGAKSLKFYAAAWKGVTGLSLNITGATVNPGSVALTADDGMTSNSPFTLVGNESDFEFTVSLSGISSETVLTLATSTTKRFVIWGAVYSAAGGDVPVAAVLDHIVLSDIQTEYTVGDEFVYPTVTAYYDDESQKPVTNNLSQTGFDSSTAATNQEVTVSYTEGGKTVYADSFYVNINEPAPVVTATYRKVTSELADYSGDYLIVYEDGNVAFDGSLETLDAASNTQAVTIAEDGTIQLSEAYEFHIASKEDGYSIQSSSGLYIGKTADSNGLDSKATDEYVNTISYVGDETSEMDVVGSGGAHLRYNANSGQDRFRFFKSSSYTGQKAISLYRKVTVESVEALILSETNGYCSSYEETDPSAEIKALYEAKWTLIKPFYDALSSEEKAQMVSGSDEALTRYDHINAKYSIESGFISGRAASSGRYVPTSTAEDSNIAIAVVAIVAVASISAIAVILIIKRRKAFDR